MVALAAVCWVNCPVPPVKRRPGLLGDSPQKNQVHCPWQGFLRLSSLPTGVIYATAGVPSQANVSIAACVKIQGLTEIAPFQAAKWSKTTMLIFRFTAYVFSDFCQHYHSKLPQNILRNPNLQSCFAITASYMFYSIFALWVDWAISWCLLALVKIPLHKNNFSQLHLFFSFPSSFSLVLFPFFHLTPDQNSEGASNDFRSIKYL